MKEKLVGQTDRQGSSRLQPSRKNTQSTNSKYKRWSLSLGPTFAVAKCQLLYRETRALCARLVSTLERTFGHIYPHIPFLQCFQKKLFLENRGFFEENFFLKEKRYRPSYLAAVAVWPGDMWLAVALAVALSTLQDGVVDARPLSSWRKATEIFTVPFISSYWYWKTIIKCVG